MMMCFSQSVGHAKRGLATKDAQALADLAPDTSFDLIDQRKRALDVRPSQAVMMWTLPIRN
jgi:hypothetical protein